MASYLWNSLFDVPPAPTGLVVTPNTGLAALDMVVTASTDPYHENYIWEAQTPDGPEWKEIGRTPGPAFEWLLAPLNVVVGIRARDNIGAPTASDPAETSATLALDRWWLTHVDGDQGFIQELRWVDVGAIYDDGLDQVTLQPLSGPADDPLAPQLPIVFTGQYTGERLTLSMTVLPDDVDLIRVLRQAAKLAPGKIAFKDPAGPVYLMQLGSQRRTVLDEAGNLRVDILATRIA